MSAHTRTPEVGTEFTPLAADRLELGEGVRLLDDGRIVLVDILAGRLLTLPYDPDAALLELARLDEPLGAVAPLGTGAGFLAAAGTGFAWLAEDSTLTSRKRLPDLEGPPPRRMNDAVCDAQGRFWAARWPTTPVPARVPRTGWTRTARSSPS
jgi:sugar lactone lactonase YvrE